MDTLQREQGLDLLEQLATLLVAAGGWLRTHLDAAGEAVSRASSSAARKVSTLAASPPRGLLLNLQAIGALNPCS